MIRALPVIRTRYLTIYAYDEIAHVRVPPGYADHPEDERILPSHSRTIRPLEIYFYLLRRYLYYLRGEHTCLKSRIHLYDALNQRSRISIVKYGMEDINLGDHNK